MMQYIFLAIILCGSSLFGAVNIDKKIDKTNAQLHSYKKNYVSLNKKLKETADAILQHKSELIKQRDYLTKLKEELAGKESSYKESITKLHELQKSQNLLKEKQDKLEEKLVFFIAKSVSFSVVLEEEYAQNEESLIEIEVLKKMLKASQDEVKKLNKDFYANEQKIEQLHSEAEALQENISSIDKKRAMLSTITKENQIALDKLQKERLSYKKELKNLIKRQNLLKDTLEQLNIVKRDRLRKEREKKEQEVAFASRKEVNLNEKLPRVKQHGNSYQRVKTIRYRGPKTIAPLAHYTISKKYGTYIDPIYGIKIFNESISLRSKTKNAKVKNVMNGKVIYADKTAVLNNIVIVEHRNGMHTIYANLSQIAPNIRKGKKLRRGAVVGRIEHELIFEVTKKNYHINPIRLFQR